MTDTRSLECCFKPYKNREPQCSRFFRIIGRDPEGKFLHLISRFYNEACVYLKDGLPECSKADALHFLNTVGARFSISRAVIDDHISIWLTQLRPVQKQALGDAVLNAVDIFRKSAPSDSTVKAAYIKFMCWLKEPFGKEIGGICGGEPPKLLVEGKLTKPSVMFLYALRCAGFDVWYVDFDSEQRYLEADPEGRLSEPVKGVISGPPLVHFSKNAAKEQKPRKPYANASYAGPDRRHMAACNSWMEDMPFHEAVNLTRHQRGEKNGGDPKVVFACCFGADERVRYRNRLYRLRKNIESSGRRTLFLDKKPEEPTASETAPFQALEHDAPRPALAQYMAGWISSGRNTPMLRQAFLQAAAYYPESPPDSFFGYLLKLACWVQRYSGRLFNGRDASGCPPVLVYYAGAGITEAALLWVLAEAGADVLYFSPDKSSHAAFSKHFLPHVWLEVLMDESMPFEPFPEREERLRAGTTAYHAERELDKLLYDDTGLYRERQFAHVQAVTLRTTFDEVWQLWNEDAQFRPAFKAEDGVVYVPNIFAKICGVDKSDEYLYWNRLKEMAVGNAYIVTELPFLKPCPLNMTMTQACAFLKGGRLDKAALKSWSGYRYGYLADNAQELILDKIQLLLDYGMIAGGGPELPALELSVLLDIEKPILGLIQNFDFTRAVPKVLIVDVTETMFSLRECILLAFLNLAGFDIAVFTPTGFRNLEDHMKPDCYETLNVGEYKYGLTVPKLRASQKAQNWFGRFFRQSG